ncbi:MAG TPA: sulfite exporter TauE/SafE family protein [Chitinophagales bacterium]|nr:sulfite exporter TauE/SafE family protein [Chitinophagales bacterium]HMW13320.1 sulfite exporter TauE/SafE family protein [Chitinophagales bacterium]HMX60495.1 sulfite exporter TauE/SafE family protein [Chitinophagales bacterium]HMY22390.1 sulfite exporter TauE/SafE family protein [Chitinophagales bacterium]HMZ33311.1 sulfite exporter TauE/SafE family protein [Chitinophagales bacterium]
MEILGYIAALFIGLSLGLIGSGGTILALPILVYLFKINDMQTATHYSMFVVGITALIGAFKKYNEKLVDIKTAIYFLIPSLISLFLTRKVLLPYFPNNFFNIGNVQITKDIFLLLLFAIVMLISSVSMIKNAQQEDVDCFAKIPNANANHTKTTLVAMLIGMLTALLGAGGGFLIIPTLVLLKEHCMKRAIGTSLVIITVNSLIGFFGDLQLSVDWKLVLSFSSIAVLGMLLGIKLSDKIAGATLKKAFGILVLIMGFFIIIKELVL